MTELSPTANALCQAVDTITNNIELLAPAIEQASNMVCGALLTENKIFTCGNGYSGPMASLLTASLMHHQGQERPALPATNISIDSASISSIAKDGNYHSIYAKQIKALARSGDLLVAFSIEGNCSNIVQAVQAAHEKEMHVITVLGASDGRISSLKNESDIEINLNTPNVPRTLEAQLLTINTLCQQIDFQLFGIEG